MNKLSRAIGLGMVAIMPFGLIGCGLTETKDYAKTASESIFDKEDNEDDTDDQIRTIRVGTWYDHYFDSNQLDEYESQNIKGDEVTQKRFQVMKDIEEKYNVRLEYVKYSWADLQKSINESSTEETPECDIYEVDYTFGIPIVSNGYAANLNEIVSADDDLFNEQNVFYPVNIGSSDETYLFGTKSAEDSLSNTYLLAYNKQLLDEAGLEDPNALYDRGEWTWDKWMEYMQVLTKDDDGDGVCEYYGFASRYDFLMYLILLSNGTNIAATETENLSSPEVGECLDFVYDMYNESKVAYPWNSEDFSANTSTYVSGKIGFWITATWISSDNSDANLGFDIVWCPFPIGPSGDQLTNYTKNATAGKAWIIPQNCDDPELVYKVFYEYSNWFDGDESLRDGSLNWYKENSLTEENYNLMLEVGSKSLFDPWNSLSINYNFRDFLEGRVGPDEFQEVNKGYVQDALDELYGKTIEEPAESSADSSIEESFE